MSSIKIFFIVGKLLFAFSICNALAENPSKIIAAKVNDHIITAQDVLDALNRLPKKIKERSLSDIYPNIVNELINQHLITKQAYNDKLDLNTEVAYLLKKNKDQIMAKYWLNNFLTNQVKKETIDKQSKHLPLHIFENHAENYFFYLGQMFCTHNVDGPTWPLGCHLFQ